jgi:hypothetical protein
MPHSCGQVPAIRQLACTANDLLLLFIEDLLVMGNQYFW